MFSKYKRPGMATACWLALITPQRDRFNSTIGTILISPTPSVLTSSHLASRSCSRRRTLSSSFALTSLLCWPMRSTPLPSTVLAAAANPLESRKPQALAQYLAAQRFGPMLDHLLDLKKEVAVDNAEFATCGFLTNAKVESVLAKSRTL